MRPNLLTLSLMTAAGFVAAQAQASPLFTDSFEYGNTTDAVDNVSAWDIGTSTVVLYDHDGGLTHAGLSQEAGGAIHHDFASGNRGGDLAISLDVFPTASAGDEFWIAGLIQLNNNNETTQIQFINGQSVNTWGFGVESDGDVVLIGSDNDGAASKHDTGADAVADGSTYLFISRATIGAGNDSDKASTIDFWFNPSDTSSVAALGTATFSTGNDSKIGRSTGSYNTVAIDLSFQSRADEVRFGNTLADVTLIPEPGSLALLGLGGLCLLGGRSRRG